MAGKREQGWNIEKQFREGQKKQRLDDLFFHFIRTAEILKPKVVIAENVEGLIRGNAKGYVNEIIKAFRMAGYKVQMFLLDSSAMGVPQKRHRVFFIGRRDDLNYGQIKLRFNEPQIKFGAVRSEKGKEISDGVQSLLLEKAKKNDRNGAQVAKREIGSDSYFSLHICNDDIVAPTTTSAGTFARYYDKKLYSDDDFINVQSFPQDYNFCGQNVQYICGMSVPPVMMANIAAEVRDQWFK